MKITWLGHASFRIETAEAVILLDPWLTGNPSFPDERRAEAIAGATHILITHGHGDHASEAAEISRETGAPVAGIYDWVTWVTEAEGIEGTGFNKGGTIMLGDAAVTMVNAVHSSSAGGPNGPIYTGAEAGYFIAAGDVTLYVMGDTDVMADMAVFQDLHAPTHAIAPIGGYFTMDAKRAAYACTKFFKLKGVIPSHYKTFPLLADSADAFAELVAPVEVLAPEVMGAVTL
ncbi:metal-dependent hydrolase [Rhodobacteraceae bacterium NNCM2]|nr:metal-dependent hydrolase [Coraliihabitans acroporae]